MIAKFVRSASSFVKSLALAASLQKLHKNFNHLGAARAKKQKKNNPPVGMTGEAAMTTGTVVSTTIGGSGPAATFGCFDRVVKSQLFRSLVGFQNFEYWVEKQKTERRGCAMYKLYLLYIQ